MFLESKEIIPMQEFLSTLSSKGQLTLPKPLRDLLKLERGGRILMEPVTGGILLKKAQVRAMEDEFTEDEWTKLKKMASKKGRTYKSGKAFLKSLR
jgi:AbrB family looped-hinge helix DNA binding protein